MFILQILSVCWTKRSRAAPLAGIRNRLPRALPLPDIVLDCEYGCHSQHHQESCSQGGTAVFLAGQPECKIWQALPVKLNGGFEFTRQADHIDIYSELNLNQYSVSSPCRTICTVCGSPPCPDLNLIHYISPTNAADGKHAKNCLP